MTRWLRKKGLLLAERQSEQAEPDALEQATQTALRLGELAHVDERAGGESAGQAARPAHGHGAHAGYSLQTSTVVAAGTGGLDRGLERLLRSARSWPSCASWTPGRSWSPTRSPW